MGLPAPLLRRGADSLPCSSPGSELVSGGSEQAREALCKQTSVVPYVYTGCAHVFTGLCMCACTRVHSSVHMCGWAQVCLFLCAHVCAWLPCTGGRVRST